MNRAIRLARLAASLGGRAVTFIADTVSRAPAWPPAHPAWKSRARSAHPLADMAEFEAEFTQPETRRMP
jgi:hypothetical protein